MTPTLILGIFADSRLPFNTELLTLFRSVKQKRALLRSNPPGITEPTKIGGKHSNTAEQNLVLPVFSFTYLC
jgi:hypothetical protein